MEKSTFRVIIVGGSIAGLTLAHCLERVGIDYLILEKASEIAPQVGASVGIFPNGSRILDQLRIYSEVEKQIEPLETATISYPDGFSFSSSYPRIIHQRFGFPIAFLDRQKLLEILYTKLPDHSRIQLRSRVVSVLATHDGVTVTTENAQTYTGQLVVGADGVHSIVTEYCCVFGISSPVKGLNVGEQVNAFYDRLTIVTIHGKNGRVYWFLIQKLDQKYRYPDNPRFGPESAAVVAERARHRRLYKNITFGQVWDSREVATMTPLEEGLLQTWHHGRMVLVGDSAHKMTPNIGQGANMAIEDAARLASLLNHLVNSRTGQQPTATDVEVMLQDYRNSRFSRARSIYNTSRFLVRFQARDGLFNTLFGRYYAPYAGDLPADMASKTIASGEVCDFLPLRSPTRAWEIYRSRKEGIFMASKEALVMVILLGLVVGYFWPLVRPNLFSAQYH
ncbi:hypothetical protein BDW72DRAFT_214420 [Aspergillus terricola var. indicus]